MAIDWGAMPESEFWDEYAAAAGEAGRRGVLRDAQKRQNELNIEVLAAQGVQSGDPWRQPQGAWDAYPENALVTHNGSEWLSLVGGNVWEPGVSGWRVAGEEWPDWVQPTGAHDAYPAGAQVTHNGARWVSDVDGNVWEPGVYGWTSA